MERLGRGLIYCVHTKEGERRIVGQTLQLLGRFWPLNVSGIAWQGGGEIEMVVVAAGGVEGGMAGRAARVRTEVGVD